MSIMLCIWEKPGSDPFKNPGTLTGFLFISANSVLISIMLSVIHTKEPGVEVMLCSSICAVSVMSRSCYPY
jgi:hypothetical protein